MATLGPTWQRGDGAPGGWEGHSVQAGACAATLGVATGRKLSPCTEFQASVLTALKMLCYAQGAGRDLSGQPQLVPSWFPHNPAHRKSSQR